MWGKVTATAGVSWDGGQDVDSPFHFPSASISPAIPRPHSLLAPASPLCIDTCVFSSIMIINIITTFFKFLQRRTHIFA